MSETSEEEAKFFATFSSKLLTKMISKSYDTKKALKLIDTLSASMMGFEHRFNETYSIDHDISHIRIDELDGFNALGWRSNFDDLSQLFEGDDQVDIDKLIKDYERENLSAKKLKEGWDNLKTIENTPEFDENFPKCDEGRNEFKRNLTMARNIRDNYQSPENICITVGAAHTLESLEGLSLYSRIKDLNPKRLILFENSRTWKL